MNKKTVFANTFKVLLPLALGGAILYWMYRDFDFGQAAALCREADWTWMVLSLPFGVTAQLFRGWRWRQTLEPVGEYPRTTTCVYAVFMSYAASLAVPRIGEFARCAVLKRHDGTSFAKAIGTVVTERAIDSIVVLAMAAIAILSRATLFDTFFDKTGTSLDAILGRFTTAGYIVTAVCAVAAALAVHLLLKKMSFYGKVSTALRDIWQGVLSLRQLRRIPLFILLTAGIWVSYILHFYVAFFAFPFTAGLSAACAMAAFVVGSIAVIVPTPNGAGPWHFAVKTMLILYGVADSDALCFVLIVHAVQTLLVILLGVYAAAALMLTPRKQNSAGA